MSDAVVVQNYSEEYFLEAEQFLQIHPSNISIHSREKQKQKCRLWSVNYDDMMEKFAKMMGWDIIL